MRGANRVRPWERRNWLPKNATHQRQCIGLLQSLWGGCEPGVRNVILVAEDHSVIPLLWNFVKGVPLCEAGDMVLNLPFRP